MTTIQVQLLLYNTTLYLQFSEAAEKIKIIGHSPLYRPPQKYWATSQGKVSEKLEVGTP